LIKLRARPGNPFKAKYSEINNTPWNQRHCYVHDVFSSMQAQQQETQDQTQEKLSQSGDISVDTINQSNKINQHSKNDSDSYGII